MFTLILVFLAPWLYVAGALVKTARTQFAWVALSAVSLFVAGFRLLLQEPWGEIAVDPAKAGRGSAVVIAKVVTELGPQITGIIILAAALYVARDAHTVYWFAKRGLPWAIRGK